LSKYRIRIFIIQYSKTKIQFRLTLVFLSRLSVAITASDHYSDGGYILERWHDNGAFRFALNRLETDCKMSIWYTLPQCLTTVKWAMDLEVEN